MDNYRTFDPMTINLKEGETVLWIGAPNPGIKLHFQGIISLGFFTLITIVAISISAITHTFSCLAIYAILLSCFYAIILFYVDPIRRQKTSYLVTNRRIVIKSSFISQSIRPVKLVLIKHITRKVHEDGTGTIIFDRDSWLTWSSFPPYYLAPVFEFIDEPNKVYDIIENARSLIS